MTNLISRDHLPIETGNLHLISTSLRNKHSHGIAGTHWFALYLHSSLVVWGLSSFTSFCESIVQPELVNFQKNDVFAIGRNSMGCIFPKATRVKSYQKIQPRAVKYTNSDVMKMRYLKNSLYTGDQVDLAAALRKDNKMSIDTTLPLLVCSAFLVPTDQFKQQAEMVFSSDIVIDFSPTRKYKIDWNFRKHRILSVGATIHDSEGKEWKISSTRNGAIGLASSGGKSTTSHDTKYKNVIDYRWILNDHYICDCDNAAVYRTGKLKVSEEIDALVLGMTLMTKYCTEQAMYNNLFWLNARIAQERIKRTQLRAPAKPTVNGK